MEICLSIITITYKDPSGLAATLDSLKVLATAGISWEHCVVDSSPEENREVLRKLPSSWPLHHLPTPARGVYPAQNLGLAESKGEIVWFLNGGDRLKDVQALARAVVALQEKPEAALWIGAVDVLLPGGALHRRLSPAKDFAQNLRGENSICHQAVLYQRSLFTRQGNFDESYRYAADYEHLLRTREAGVDPLISEEAIVEFCLGGASSQNMRATFREFRRAQKANSSLRSLQDRLQDSIRWWLGYLRVTLLEKFRRNGS